MRARRSDSPAGSPSRGERPARWRHDASRHAGNLRWSANVNDATNRTSRHPHVLGTWYEPCREELPLLSRYADQHAAAGLRVLGFSLDSPDELPEVRKVARTLSFPVGLLANSSAPGHGRIWRLPVNFTVDRAGLLVVDGWKEKQPTWTAERLEQIVTPLLAVRN